LTKREGSLKMCEISVKKVFSGWTQQTINPGSFLAFSFSGDVCPWVEGLLFSF
jgi:hypothetical protein